MRKRFLPLLFPLLFQTTSAQETSPLPVYKVNTRLEIPLSLGLFAYNSVGFKLINNKPVLDSLEISQLKTDDIPAFDRVATQQDASNMERANSLSDYGMNASVLLPFCLMFDRQIRKDWFDLMVLYAETHAINSAIYVMGAGFFDRTRPFPYNPDVDYEKKIGKGTQVSFFSGHVSTAAAASFFMAKVYSDYHPNIGTKKYWLYAASLVPPVFVGYYRVKAMKHFPTDVITGTLIGAATGVVIPQLHKIQYGNGNLSIMPFFGESTGLNLHYSFN